MLSSVPVSSPTAVIWTTMGGNRPLDCRGTAILSPSRMLLRTLSMACDTTLFSTALATTSSACMIGTPLLISVPRVREAGDGHFPHQRAEDRDTELELVKL